MKHDKKFLFADVDVDKPDEKSIMTYVAQFVKAYPDTDTTTPQHIEGAGANKVWLVLLV